MYNRSGFDATGRGRGDGTRGRGGYRGDNRGGRGETKWVRAKKGGQEVSQESETKEPNSLHVQSSGSIELSSREKQDQQQSGEYQSLSVTELFFDQGMKERIDQLKETYKINLQEHTNRVNQITELNRALDQCNQIVRDLEGQSQQYQQQAGILEKERMDKETEIITLTDKINQSESIVNNLNEQKAQMDRTIKEDNANHKEQLEQLNEQIIECANQLEESKSDFTNYENLTQRDLSSIAAEQQECQKQIEEIKKQLTQKEKNIDLIYKKVKDPSFIDKQMEMHVKSTDSLTKYNASNIDKGKELEKLREEVEECKELGKNLSKAQNIKDKLIAMGEVIRKISPNQQKDFDTLMIMLNKSFNNGFINDGQMEKERQEVIKYKKNLQARIQIFVDKNVIDKNINNILDEVCTYDVDSSGAFEASLQDSEQGSEKIKELKSQLANDKDLEAVKTNNSSNIETYKYSVGKYINIRKEIYQLMLIGLSQKQLRYQRCNTHYDVNYESIASTLEEFKQKRINERERIQKDLEKIDSHRIGLEQFIESIEDLKKEQDKFNEDLEAEKKNVEELGSKKVELERQQTMLSTKRIKLESPKIELKQKIDLYKSKLEDLKKQQQQYKDSDIDKGNKIEKIAELKRQHLGSIAYFEIKKSSEALLYEKIKRDIEQCQQAQYYVNSQKISYEQYRDYLLPQLHQADQIKRQIEQPLQAIQHEITNCEETIARVKTKKTEIDKRFKDYGTKLQNLEAHNQELGEQIKTSKQATEQISAQLHQGGLPNDRPINEYETVLDSVQNQLVVSKEQQTTKITTIVDRMKCLFEGSKTSESTVLTSQTDAAKLKPGIKNYNPLVFGTFDTHTSAMASSSGKEVENEQKAEINNTVKELEIEALKRGKQQLEVIITKISNERDNLNKEIKSIQEQLTNMRKETEIEALKRGKQLEVTITKISNERDNLNKEIKSVQEQLTNMRKEKVVVEHKAKELEVQALKDKKQQEESVRKLESTILGLNDKSEEIAVKINSDKEVLQITLQEQDGIRSLIDGVKQELSNMRSKKAGLDKELTNITEEKAKLEQDIKTKEPDIKELKGKRQQIEEEIGNIRTDIGKKQSEKRNLEAWLAKNNENIKNMQKEKEGLERKISTCQEELPKLKTEGERLEKEIKPKIAEVGSLEEENQQLEIKASNIKGTIQKNKLEIKQREAELRRERKVLKPLQDQQTRKDLEEKYQMLDNTLKELFNSKLEKCENVLQTSKDQDELKKAKKQLDKTHSDIEAFQNAKYPEKISYEINGKTIENPTRQVKYYNIAGKAPLEGKMTQQGTLIDKDGKQIHSYRYHGNGEYSIVVRPPASEKWGDMPEE